MTDCFVSLPCLLDAEAGHGGFLAFVVGLRGVRNTIRTLPSSRAQPYRSTRHATAIRATPDTPHNAAKA